MIKSLGTYEFPSRSRQELYGDDILVSVLRRNSMFFCSAAMFRAPKAMKWSEFVENMVMPYVTADPDFDSSKEITWQLVEEDFTPDPDKSLDENGVRHKNTISLIGA